MTVKLTSSGEIAAFRDVFVAWSGPELLKLRAEIAALQAQIAHPQTQTQTPDTPPSAENRSA